MRCTGKNHRITVNSNLNKFSFLITLLHELAHLLTYEQYGHRVAAHGKTVETYLWEFAFGFVHKNIFPPDIEDELKRSLANPAASSCAEEHLMRVLRKYDTKKEGIVLVEELPVNALFVTKDGRVFRKGEKLRKRYRCTELKTDMVYLFSAIYEVVAIK